MYVQLAMAAGQAIAGGIQAKNAREAAATAQADLDAKKAQFAALDTSNPYANMENVYEDLTIDQRAAQFQAQQAAQSQANIMQQMRQSAGTSGIAALAQTLAQQGQLSSQQAAATIAQQEQANQRAMMGEASRLQGLERQGEMMSRQMKFDKLDTLMGFDASDLAAARQQQAMGRQQMIAGIGSFAGGIAGGIADGSFGGTKRTPTIKDTSVNVDFNQTTGQTTSQTTGSQGGFMSEYQASGLAEIMSFAEWLSTYKK